MALNKNDDRTWIDLFTKDAVFECPYAPVTTKRFEGKEAIYTLIKTVYVQMPDLRFSNIRIYPTTNPNIAWAEFHGEAVVVATGHPYQQDYVVRVETREGQVVQKARIRESYVRDRGVGWHTKFAPIFQCRGKAMTTTYSQSIASFNHL